MTETYGQMKARKAREWYWANRDRARAYQAVYHAENKDRIKAKQDEWRAAHRKSIAAKQRAYTKNGRVPGFDPYDAAMRILAKLKRKKWRRSWRSVMRRHFLIYLARAYSGE